MTDKSIAALAEPPHSKVFCGPQKYLLLQKHEIVQRLFPVLEFESFFILVRSGHGRFIINGLPFEAAPGTVAWIQGTQVLTIETEPGEKLKIWTIMADYSTINYLMFQDDIWRCGSAVMTVTPVIGPGVENASKIRRIFEDLNNINNRRSNGAALIKVSLLGQLALHFSEEAFRIDAEHLDESRSLAYRACIYIATHTLKIRTAEDAARDLGTDSASLNRHLRAATGMGFMKNLNRARCLLAASFFLCDGLPFDYIARLSGFSSELSFYRNFKKIMGATPSEYRQMLLSSGGAQHYHGMITDDRVIAVITYIYDNFTETVSLESIAKNTFTSGTLVSSLLTRTFGVSYKQILTLFRVRYSESLLSSSALPLQDISILSGFNSVNAFNRNFMKINHQTPSEYRRLCRKEG